MRGTILHKGWEGAAMMPVATEDVCVMDLPIRGTSYKGHQVDVWGLVSNAMGTHVDTKYRHPVPSIKTLLNTTVSHTGCMCVL